MYEYLSRRRRPGGFRPIEISIERSPLGDTSLHFHVRPSALVALLLAILLHIVVLYLVTRHKPEPEQPLGANGQISGRLISPEPPRPRAEPKPPQAEPAPTPPKPSAKKQDKARRNPPRTQVITAPPVVRAPDPKPAPYQRPPKPAADAPVDMMAFVNAQRERRQAAEDAAARENAEASARERGPSAEQVANANIKRNLETPGTNGVFQITRKGVRTAAFAFRGWTTDAANAKREFIEVDAGVNGDIERAVVRRMIELIRRYYKGNFNWESRRLGHTLVLSAAPENNDQLEDFLIQEFFRAGAYYPP